MTENRTLRTSRTLPYSPREIYGAFASPDLLALWWGPEGFSNTFEIFEFTAGGRWKFVMHGPDGNHYSNESIFVTLVPDTRIVIRHDCPPHFVLAVELTPVSDGTLLTWEQVFEDAQTAQAIKRRVGSANEQNIDRLTNVLSKTPGAAYERAAIAAKILQAERVFIDQLDATAVFFILSQFKEATLPVG